MDEEEACSANSSSGPLQTGNSDYPSLLSEPQQPHTLPQCQHDGIAPFEPLTHTFLCDLDRASIHNARKSFQKVLLIRDLHMESASPLASLSLGHTRLRGTALVSAEWSCPTDLRYHFDTDGFLVEIALCGQASHRFGHEYLSLSPNSGVVLEGNRLHQEKVRAGYRGLFLRLEREALENRLSAVLQRPIRQPLVFAQHLDLTARGQSLWHLLTWICNELREPGSLLRHNSAIANKIETLLLDMFLASHDSNYSTALAAREPLAIPRHLRAVMVAVQTAPEQAWSLAAMAAQAGVSVRTLCEAFRRFNGSTPMEFLRSARLVRARDQLQELGPHASIAAIAKQWGFGHPGRFAAAYAQAFGETPSETLRGKKRGDHVEDFPANPIVSGHQPRISHDG